MDVHLFDGQLQERINKWDPYLEKIEEIEYPEKARAFRELILLLSERKASRSILGNVVRIIKGINRDSNYDETNDVYAEDLLYLIYLLYHHGTLEEIGNSNTEGSDMKDEKKIERQNDLLDLLTTQLDELSTGLCPQGRCHRLIQVLHCYLD